MATAGQRPSREAGAAGFTCMPCVRDRKLLHPRGAPRAPLGRGGLSQTLDGVSLEAVGASLGRSPLGEGVSLSTPAELPACLLSGSFPLGKLPYSPA